MYSNQTRRCLKVMSNPIRLDAVYDNIRKQPIKEAYRDISLVDDGGACNIYRAVDRLLGRIVIVRALKEEHCANHDIREAFIDCSRYQYRIPTVSNIAKTFMINESQAFIEMECRVGYSMNQWSRIRFNSVRSRIKQIQLIHEAIASLHMIGISHGSLTPRSIIIEPDGNIVFIGIGALRLWLTMQDDSLNYASRYLPQWWMSNQKTTYIDNTRGFQADVYSITAISQELWQYDNVDAPVNINNMVMEYLDKQLRNPPTDASNALNNFTDKFGGLLEEHDHIKKEKAKWLEYVTERRSLASEYFNNCAREWRKRLFLERLVHIIFGIGCLAGGIFWLLFWQDCVVLNDVKNRIVMWLGYGIGPLIATFLFLFFWIYWQRNMKRQIYFVMKKYFEPRISQDNLTWEEAMIMLERHFQIPSSTFLVIKDYIPSKLRKNKRYAILHDVRLLREKYHCFKKRLKIISIFFCIVNFILVFVLNFIIEDEIGECWGFLYRVVITCPLWLLLCTFSSLIIKCCDYFVKSRVTNRISNMVESGIANGYITRDEAISEVL